MIHSEQQKYEFVQYPKMKHVRIIVNQINYKHTHMHPDLELAILLSGNGQINVEEKPFIMDPGDVLLINSSTPHSYSSSSKDEQGLNVQNSPTFLIIQISNSFLSEYCPEISTTIFQSTLFKKSENTLMHVFGLQYLIELALIYFQGNEHYHLILLSELSRLIYHIYCITPHQVVSKEESEKIKLRKNRLERIIDTIKKNFESQIKLSDIAEQENLTRTYVSHLFKSSLGITFQDYVNNLRLEQAIRLMSEGKKSLLEISFESGFSDPKYMFKMFEKNLHCTPREYRKNLSVSSNFTNKDLSARETIFSEARSIEYLKSCPFYSPQNSIGIDSNYAAKTCKMLFKNTDHSSFTGK